MSDCVFCKIADGSIPADIVAQNDHAVAFRDLDPKAPVHVLVIPTQHVASVRDASGPDADRLLGALFQFAAGVATDLGLDERGYRLVTNTGPDGGQSVFHLHIHVLGGRLMAWPPG
ncbi:MAG: histidine triad nucleotide-binding protein [Gemmatimonadales bacterium]|nr:histidine triad nucleotide-binding protein [Gemmatimonadales bacterium]